MTELINAALLLINLPFTILLGLVLVYWLFVILGGLNMHGLHVDAHGFHFDAPDVDAHVEVDGGGGDQPAFGSFYPMLAFLNIGKVPFMVIFSFLILFMWMGAILANHYLNSGAAILFAALLLIPNFLIATILTKIVTLPLVPLFRALTTDPDLIETAVGQACIVTLAADEDKVGQAEVTTGGAPLLVSVKPLKGGAITKGTKAIIIKKSDTRDFYWIDLLND